MNMVPRVVVGNRLNFERLEFVYKYTFPPDHNSLLSVRQHKKERAASEAEAMPTSEENQTETVGEQPEFAQDLTAVCPEDREESEDEL